MVAETGTTVSGPDYDQLVRDLASLGVLFNCEPSDASPDLERLLLDVARCLPENARLLPLVATWLVLFGQFVARHRLRQLARNELEPEYRPVLGFLLDAAIHHGAVRSLQLVVNACEPSPIPGPLFRSHRTPTLAQIAERNASAISKKWGLWAPAFELKRDAVRPVTWLLDRNPGYRRRAIRKGDLRASIVEALTRDFPGARSPSTSRLAELVGATRRSTREAVKRLCLEGAVVIGEGRENDRDLPVAVRRPT
jgi:hypothetical protein